MVLLQFEQREPGLRIEVLRITCQNLGVEGCRPFEIPFCLKRMGKGYRSVQVAGLQRLALLEGLNRCVNFAGPLVCLANGRASFLGLRGLVHDLLPEPRFTGKLLAGTRLLGLLL